MSEKAPKSKRVCIFCGRSPTTREHHPPQWIQECFPQVQGSTNYFISANREMQRRGESRFVAAQVIKHVCKNCNTGWMRLLENLAKPILSPMIQGESIKLRWLDQVTLATWLVKSALTIAPLWSWDSTGKYAKQYDLFYRQKRVSDDYEISIASCETNNMSSMIFNPRTLTETRRNGEIIQYEVFFYTVLIGHFVGTVACRPARARGKLPDWPRFPFLEIWPGRSGPIRKRWPPETKLTAKAIHEIGAGPDPEPDAAKPDLPEPVKKI